MNSKAPRSKHSPTPKRGTDHKRAQHVLAVPAGTLSLYAAYLVIAVRLMALAFHNVDLQHLD